MNHQGIAQTNQQEKSETSQASRILQRSAVRSVSEAEMQSTEDKEVQPLGNSALSKDFSRVPLTTTKPQQIMAKLTIGAVGDKYEQEADRVAAQVVQRINAPASVQSGEDETVQQEEMETKDNEARLMRSPILQRQSSGAGMAATPDLEASINRARGDGQPLANNVRKPMEKAFGADFSGVKVHTDAQANQLNQSIQARAFTTGQNVFFRQGEYNPGSQGGQKLLAHELTHVVQQNGGAVRRSPEAKGIGTILTEGENGIATATTKVSNSNVMTGLIQRDIGFEFETKQIKTKKLENTNTPLPVQGFANSQEAKVQWERSQRLEKGEALLKKADIEVQADDVDSITSNLEVVTTHFPLDANGRNRLNVAMQNLTALVNAYTPFAQTADGIVPAVALNGTAGFNTTMHNGMFGGSFATAQTRPQITFGIRVENVVDIVHDLHDDRAETPAKKALRDPGRLRMRGPNPANPKEPKDISPGDEMQTLITGRTRARSAIIKYRQHQDAQDALQEIQPQLEGFLTIVFSYCESMQHKKNFLKNHTPLMAKTDLATIFTTLPNDVKAYYSQKDGTGRSNLERLVAISLGDARMNQPLFAGVKGLVENDKDGQPDNWYPEQWYHKLTLESWLRGIVLRDRTKMGAIKQIFKDKYNGSKKRPGTDQLSNKYFPDKPRGQNVEGYAALGEKMDEDVTNPATKLPIFELRSVSNPITYIAAQQWALDLFDYIRSLNENPQGEHNLML
ncbi:eCIS core domain-containing protein [Nostoc sp.]|uniref:eCIS core domain-containing protein n=1 Tax=Nostoc sp. TaxID=1180 RepID=UPI002FF657C8